MRDEAGIDWEKVKEETCYDEKLRAGDLLPPRPWPRSARPVPDRFRPVKQGLGTRECSPGLSYANSPFLTVEQKGMLITFSGLDGAGKTTLIGKLNRTLRFWGYSVAVLTMYDHIGVYAFVRYLRDTSSRLATKLVQASQDADVDPAGLSRPAKSSEPSMVTRLILRVARNAYMRRIVNIIDLCLFPFYRLYFEKWRRRVLILDRYFYDSLADVADGRNWLYIRLFLKLVPNPDLPVFVDVCPEKAYARKGEYSVKYLTKRRGFYQKIFGWIRHPLVLANEELESSTANLEAELQERICEH